MEAAKKNDIIHTSRLSEDLRRILEPYENEQILILTDDLCYKYCISEIIEIFSKKTHILSLKPGERNKNLSNLEKIWSYLLKHQFTRHSIIVNLGGGIITDMGGFAASTYKRGMHYINIPTSLLAQVDASLGGKTGINYQHLKNMIGIINLPDYVLISSTFLKTLKKREFLSGFAEMIKHALLRNERTYRSLIAYFKNDHPDYKILEAHIKRSIEIKAGFIQEDLFESGRRKALNFGHTFGHAFESHHLSGHRGNNKLKHGEAVAFGMICELYLSSKKMHFPEAIFQQVRKDIHSIYGYFHVPITDFCQIYDLMQSDKKNKGANILCVLLKEIGDVVCDIPLSEGDVYDALEFLNTSN